MAMTAHVLIVAGTDSSGGAGLSRDVETVATFGLRSAIAVTAVTVQTHTSVERIEPMPPDLVAEQMRAALASSRVAAIKIGMLSGNATIEAVAAVLRDQDKLPVVLDPVLASSSGRSLLGPEAIGSLTRELMPLCAIATPNLIELGILTGEETARDEAQVEHQARRLLETGCAAILVKGGHATGPQSIDMLVVRQGREPMHFVAPRLDKNMRGTGCMLASAIAAGLALGKPLEDCVHEAKRHVFEQIVSLGRRQPV
ncbi:bifunctional hydroxymethylpyrimidine kinase/phosphomethylpyrimidine kinase [Pseudaminobacter soli (ex Li et al. 2025)]|uniref:hydroxymethylpyrimidine kinase n=1 Tax=Pseudaminobacter soli (ex Li et al. 2025) TaxID=1295366 RepID=A0A2P7SKT1_9HYPH|nr:hydroxymethylpyrimidine/phosphomethylpyrimidine kinase [Mesorhizobium soli]PSJ62995.1 hydroxymethylpyrimidine/phosphomethylpyrimidine kinase [Mesorhizobium soli]